MQTFLWLMCLGRGGPTEEAKWVDYKNKISNIRQEKISVSASYSNSGQHIYVLDELMVVRLSISLKCGPVTEGKRQIEIFIVNL